MAAGRAAERNSVPGYAGSSKSGSGSSSKPVLLDLDGNGLSVDPLSTSAKFVELDGDDLQHRTAWAGDGDGVLVLDLNGDGRITEEREFVFAKWDATADGDLDALRKVFDTNGNGKLDAGDRRWSEFKVEVNGELKSLGALGIASIDLIPSGSGQSFADGSAITGTTKFTRTDGTTGTAGDAVLASDAAGYRLARGKVVKADGSVIETVAGFDRGGSLAFTNEITTSADGRTVQTRFDDNGDGVFDRSQVDALAVSTGGTRTRTVSDYNGDGTLAGRTVTATSADGRTVTTTLDPEGDGVFNEREVYVVNPDGSSVTTVEELSRSAVLLKRLVTTASADGLTKTVATDPTGSGAVDRVSRETTVIGADKSRTRTEALQSRDGTLIGKTVTATSADGRKVATTSDLDGDGDVDLTEKTSLSLSADGSITSVVDTYNGDGSRLGKMQSTTSADGLIKTTSADLTGDGVADLATSEVTTNVEGVRTESFEVRSASGALLSKSVTTTKAGAPGMRVQQDSDGDGLFDREQVTSVDAAGTSRTTVLTLNADGSRKAYALATVSADGLSSTTEVDITGDGTVDASTTDQTVVNSDGSRTRTVSARSRDGRLIGQEITQTSGDGLTVTGRQDINGDGAFDLASSDVTVGDASGSRSRTVTTSSGNGTLLSKTVVKVSAGRSTTTTTVDEDGDGTTDLARSNVVNGDGKVVETTTVSAKGAVIGKTIATTSADKLTTTLEEDSDGNGTIDVKRTRVAMLNANGSRAETASVQSSDGTLLSKGGTTVSGNGLTTDSWSDVNGDGKVDARSSDVTVLNQNGSRTRTISTQAGSGQLVSRTIVTVNATGLSTVEQADLDGDGAVDRATSKVKTLKTDGAVVDSVSVKNGSGQLLSSVTTTTAANKRKVTISTDLDGNKLADVARTTVTNPNGSVTDTVSTYAPQDQTNKMTSRTKTTVSADGLANRVEIDVDGNGSIDRIDEAVTLLNANGSRSETIKRSSGAGVAKELTTVEASADGLSRTVNWAATGGAITRSLSEQKTINADGSTVETATYSKAGGVLESRTVRTVSASKQTETLTRDIDGDGIVDQQSVAVTNKGSKTTTLTELGADGVTAIARKTIVEAANGLSTTIDYDTDGNGSRNSRTTEKTVLNANGSATTTTTRANASLQTIDTEVVEESADGLSVTARWDLDADNVIDQSRGDVTTINIDSSKTRVVSNFSGGTLTSRIETTTSANGLVTTTRWDLDGSGAYEQASTDQSVLDVNGSVTRSVTGTRNGTMIARSTTVTSADGRTISAAEERPGMGLGNLTALTSRTSLADGTDVEKLSVSDATGKLLETQTATTSGDGREVRIVRDADGNGTTDQIEQRLRLVDGSQKTVTTGYGTGGAKSYQSTTVVAADGLSATTEWDMDGNGSIDRRRKTTSAAKIDGSQSSTISDTSASGTLLKTSTATVSADGLTRVVKRDVDGDGTTDTTETSIESVTGAIVTTTANNTEARKDKYLVPGDVYWEKSVAAKIRTTVSADGLKTTVESDRDGNGTYEQTMVSIVQIDGSVQSKITETNANGTIKATGTLSESADGRVSILRKDVGNDGKVDLTQTAVTALDGTIVLKTVDLNANGSTKQTVTEAFDPTSDLVSRLTTDALGRKTAELLVNADGTMTNSTYDGPSGALLSATKLNKDGLITTATLYDPLGKESWSTVTQTYSAGQLATQKTRNDDGTYYTTTFDPTNSQTWSQSTSFYNAAGQRTQLAYLNDSGTRSITTFDPTNAQTWSSIAETLNAAGQLTNQVVRSDDGTYYTTTFDPTNSQTWSQSTSFYNAAAQKTQLYKLNDDGSWSHTFYDPTNVQGWSSLMQSLNAAGQLTYQVMKKDDGTAETLTPDASNSQPWSHQRAFYNAAGQKVGEEKRNDDGSWRVAFFDPTNVQPWSQQVQRTNTAGQLNYQRTNYDSGSYISRWYDPADEKSWDYRDKTYTTSGRTYWYWHYDDGRESWGSSPILLDLNSDDHIDLRPLDPEALAGPRFDWDGDQASDQTAWVGPQDGFLAIDIAADGSAGPDGVIDQARELAFSLWAVDEEDETSSDLEGLRIAFDSNRDNVFDDRDQRWHEFRVWQDRNQNGLSEADELQTLGQAGIRLINLLPSEEGTKLFGDGSEITGTSTMEMADGSKRLVGDAMLSFKFSPENRAA